MDLSYLVGKPMSQSSHELWSKEYEMGGIPSSTRTSPSGAMKWAFEELKHLQTPLRTAADIGCGKGRNSIYLARQGLHVTAMDFTPNAIRQLQETAAEQGLSDQIRPIVQDITDPWPVAEGSMDLVIDAFCFKHITGHAARVSYKEQLLRALRSRGHYMISFASIGDGYYGRYVVKHDVVDGEEEHLCIDPANGIESVLYTKKGILRFFAPELDLFEELHHNKPSVMHGKEYERSVYALLLRRNPHMV
jgi:SAM-dependent methyltransferase